MKNSFRFHQAAHYLLAGDWALTVLLLWLCLCANAAGADVPSWPTHAWPESTPESQGMDSASLAQAVESGGQRQVNIHSLLIVRNGVVVLDAYFYPYGRGSTHDVASVTKSITSVLVGIAIDQ